MQLAHARLATAPRRFGRGPVRIDFVDPPVVLPAISADVKLFATTFAAGFLFVSCFLA